VNAELVLARLALGLYAGGAVLAFAAVLGGRPALLRGAHWLAAAGLLFQAIEFAVAAGSDGRCPLILGSERIAFLGWGAIFLYLLAAYRYRLDVLAVLILPLAVVLILISNFLPPDVVRVPIGLFVGMRYFHIGVATLGSIALFLAFGAAVAYLMQERRLKVKRPSRFSLRLPPLDRCEDVGHRALLWGFPLLTLAIGIGAVYSANVSDRYWVPRETSSLLAWSLVAVVLFARLVSGWRGRKASYLTILAFTAILVRMVVVPLL